ncbi:hypothetical protein [Arthrobacter sp. NyZ413]
MSARRTTPVAASAGSPPTDITHTMVEQLPRRLESDAAVASGHQRD